MRLFLTVNMDPDVKEEVFKQIPAFKTIVKSGRWVAKENLHITMLFLGEVEKEKLTLVEGVMNKAVKGIDPFNLWIEGIGTFPNEKRPNVLWAGVKGDILELNSLYYQLVAEIGKTELPFDAKPKYTPHVTLARKIDVFPAGVELKTKGWQVNSLELYQSTFVPGGVKYQRILEKKFNGKE